MKVLKAAICLVLTALILISPCFPAAPARAAEPVPSARAAALAGADAPAAPAKKYAYVDLGCNAYLCGEPNESTALFLIPQTYCVEILGEQKEWYRVRYAEDNGIYRAVEGFCLKADLIECDSPLENLYLHMQIKVIYKTDQPNGLLPGLGEIELTAAYYGAYRIGKTDCSYVLCNDKFAYIPEAITDYPMNTLPERPTIAPVKKGGTSAALIAAIVVTVAAAAAITVLYFTGKRPPKPTPPA